MAERLNTIFLVDDDAEMRAATGQWLELSGYNVTVFSDALSALNALEAGFPGVVVSDVRMPKMDGIELLTRLNRLDPDIPVILVSAHGDVQMAVDAMRLGAYDFIEKPFDPERLLEIVQRSMEKRRLVIENRDLRRQLAGPETIEHKLIGNSEAICRLRDDILDVADTDAPVLITGETGTGKEVVARCLHAFGGRSKGKYVAVNCGAVPENMFESELFGHERGAFTGADRRRIGRFEYARGGVLFLDEIGVMPLPMQIKVLRVLQEREVVRIGSNESQSIDVRLISATNKDLRQGREDGSFREDLYYRINVVELHVPPLRERGGDILLLFDYFAGLAAAHYKRPEASLQGTDISLLLSHDWPGNVRELKNLAERFVLSSLPLERRLGSMIQQGQAQRETTGKPSLQAMMRQHERLLLEQTLAACRGDVQAMMAALDLPRRTLNEKLQKHGLDRKNYL